jgi:hypothetical protein
LCFAFSGLLSGKNNGHSEVEARSEAMSKHRRDEGITRSVAAYEVGYGKPPIATRFGVRAQPDRSNNPIAKPKSPALDIAALLDQPIQAKVDGRSKRIHPHEAMLHGLFRRGVEGEIRALQALLQYCRRAGLLDSPAAISGSVIHAPEGVPMELVARLVRYAGAPPWDSELFDQLEAEYDRDIANLEKLKSESKGYGK